MSAVKSVQHAIITCQMPTRHNKNNHPRESEGLKTSFSQTLNIFNIISFNSFTGFTLLLLLLQATMSNGSGLASKLARTNILELQPYRCARDDYSQGILLDANENAWGPPIDNVTEILERYPDPYQIPLKEKMAAFRGEGLKPENIFVGVGSDEAIDLLFRIFCVPGKDKVITTPPTYGMYKVCAKVNDVDIINVPLTPEFDVRIPEVSHSFSRCAS